MGFKLVIECSKDIDKLEIDFSDGTSVVTHSEKVEPDKLKQRPEKSVPVTQSKQTQSKQTQSKQTQSKQEQFLDTDVKFDSASQDVIQLPEIDDIDRPVSVADELQNLDI